MGNIGSVPIEWEPEERILALKLNTSQNSSTSVGPGRTLLNSLDSSKENELEQRTSDQNPVSLHNGPSLERIGSSQDDKELKDTEKVHWEPPCNLTMHQK